MSGTWAGGPDDQERKWHRLDNAVFLTDLVLGDATLDPATTKLDEVNADARIWKTNARANGYEFVDVKSDAEAFALPQWAPVLERLRAFGLPVQRVRSLVRGERGGVRFENLCVCDADEDGKVLPYRVWVLPLAAPLPELICDYRSSRGEVPDEAAWCEAPGEFARAAGFRADRPVIKEGRFTKNLIGRAIAGKVNEFLDTSVQVTVWARDAGVAQRVAEAARKERDRRRVVWLSRGGWFIYATPDLDRGADAKSQQHQYLFAPKLVELQREYAALLNG
ncbi:hypothetical protein [Glycomyces sp. NPDC048151]|uniref:hypothetical protein n=1 Tax=Glycomyces sp. NPDC048151 TaxID=3364002 RepID=UPI00371F620F